MFCGKCGTEFKPADKFCQNCGAELNYKPSLNSMSNDNQVNSQNTIVVLPREAVSDVGMTLSNNEKVEVFMDGSPHPWRRFFARTFDLLTVGLLVFVIASFLIGYLFPSIAKGYAEFASNQIGASVTLYLLWLPTEAAFISLAGATPGKWIFGIRVISMSGKLLSYSEAIERAALVWFKGDGLGIPIISMFARAIAYEALNKTGTTSWDKAIGSVVKHRPWGAARAIFCTLSVILALAMLGVLSSIKNH